MAIVASARGRLPLPRRGEMREAAFEAARQRGKKNREATEGDSRQSQKLGERLYSTSGRANGQENTRPQRTRTFVPRIAGVAAPVG